LIKKLFNLILVIETAREGVMNRWEMEKKISIAAIKDPAFKKKLLANPKEALKSLFKGELDQAFLERLDVKVQEEKKNEWVISLPYVEMQRKTLSDEELEKIAGGSWCQAPGSL
jgi:Xaa-Pro aminopeptidase